MTVGAGRVCLCVSDRVSMTVLVVSAGASVIVCRWLCVGRAIRHKDDYACILLLDQRYLRPNIQQKLPGWIASRLNQHDTFGPALSALCKVRTASSHLLNDHVVIYWSPYILYDCFLKVMRILVAISVLRQQDCRARLRANTTTVKLLYDTANQTTAIIVIRLLCSVIWVATRLMFRMHL